MARDDVQVINDYGGGHLSRRTSKTGRSRYTITIHSDPILVNTNARDLSRGPAEAIAQHYRDEIGGITAPISKSTEKTQAAQERALQAGKPWAGRRYGGGRIGTMQPQRTGRLFNNSGRFIKSIAVAAITDGWIINMARNRADPATTDGEAGLIRMFDRLRQLVPTWGDARELKNVLSVQRAIRTGLAGAIEKANQRTAALKKQLMSQGLGIARRFIGLAG